MEKKEREKRTKPLFAEIRLREKKKKKGRRMPFFLIRRRRRGPWEFVWRRKKGAFLLPGGYWSEWGGKEDESWIARSACGRRYCNWEPRGGEGGASGSSLCTDSR